ncbi:ABC transporter ATP-binding protein [Paenibacillus sp. UMB7766-LJ446]|uniref:ABC transporter ATP-binding protein n=1 Tax=Paenibacillus sp. UMB7766-LJ446 TaxID=3046313 RepID=UPI00254B3C3F|nr:ABC transporter ATP-binding protein [Paenibacillus sp. UMB7766-LJ446]MDK8191931.1 ABC transporter ATP-binding protein [Paenibacillus sp. UMB7766-LJ446]
MELRFSTRQTVSLIWSYTKKYGILLVFLPFLMLVDVIFELGVAKIQGLFIDTATSSTKEHLFYLVQIVVALLVAGILLLAVHRHIIVKILGYVHRDLTLKLFAVLNHMPYEEIKKYHSGELTSRLKEDIEHGSQIIEAIIEFITVLLLIILSFVYLIRIDLVLALLGAVGSPVLFLIGRIFDQRIRYQASRVQEDETKLRETSQEFIQGLPVIRMYGAKSLYLNQFMEQRGTLNQSQTKLAMSNAMSRIFTERSFQLVYVTALIFIAIAASRNTLTPGAIVTFSVLFELVIWPVIGLSDQYSRLQEGVGAFQRINKFLNTKTSTNENETVHSDDRKPIHEDTIIFMRDVSYQPQNSEQTILEHINFELKKREKVIVIGSSGSGKSTFSKICSGLYQPTSGEFRSAIDKSVYVGQSIFLFSGTVGENIKLAMDEATELDILHAASLAGMNEDIERLPLSYDTSLSEKGDNFSGGQKQRLGLARAFIHQNSPLVIMDEPTSALDQGKEQIIINALETFLQNKAAILITHRLNLIPLADRIILMEDGRIAEDGTHDELMKLNGKYRTLHDLHHSLEDFIEE